MTSDNEQIAAIAALAAGKIGDESIFAFPEALEAIKLCMANGIAVLGVEIFRAHVDRYHTQSISTYDLRIDTAPEQLPEWTDYVSENNSCAADFINRNPTGDDHVYVLTTASWREFLEVQKIRCKWRSPER